MTASPPPRRRSDSVHGESPAAAASDARQTSPPTMHTPVRTTLRDLRGHPRQPRRRRGHGERRGDEGEQADVLERALAGGGVRGEGEVPRTL